MYVIIQTCFIVDGLGRCSNSRELLSSRPGREFITFLILANLASWINETFKLKSHEAYIECYDFYGDVLWTLLSHFTLPMCLFYRFHASVCLVDMWKGAYQPDH